MKYIFKTLLLFFIVALLPINVQGSTTYKKYTFKENEKFLFQYEDKSYFLVNNLQFKNSLCTMNGGNFTPINSLHFSNKSNYLGIFDGKILFSLGKELWRFNPSDNSLVRDENISTPFIRKFISQNASNHTKISANISEILKCFDGNNFLFSFSGKLDNKKIYGIATNKGDYKIIPKSFSFIQSNNDGSIWISCSKYKSTKLLKLNSNLDYEEFTVPLNYTNFKKDYSVVIKDNTLYLLSSKNTLDKYQLTNSQFKKVNSTNISKNHCGKLPTLTIGVDNCIYTLADNKFLRIHNSSIEHISDIPNEANSLFVFNDQNFVANYSYKNPKNNLVKNINFISSPIASKDISTLAHIDDTNINTSNKTTSLYYTLTIVLLIFVTISFFKFNRKREGRI